MWARVSRGCGWRAWPRASAGALDVTRRGRDTGHAEDVEVLARRVEIREVDLCGIDW